MRSRGHHPSRPPCSQQIVVSFDADSAYAYVAQQVLFRPKVPTRRHTRRVQNSSHLSTSRCGSPVQEGRARAFDGAVLNMKNIVGTFHPGPRPHFAFAIGTRPLPTRTPASRAHRWRQRWWIGRRHAPWYPATGKTADVGVDIMFLTPRITETGMVAVPEDTTRRGVWEPIWSKTPIALATRALASHGHGGRQRCRVPPRGHKLEVYRTSSENLEACQRP